jgi:hypothetical protein
VKHWVLGEIDNKFVYLPTASVCKEKQVVSLGVVGDCVKVKTQAGIVGDCVEAYSGIVGDCITQ